MRKNPDVDAYIAAAPAEHAVLLKTIRTLIRKELPTAEECFESKMPVYKIGGVWTSGFAWRAKGVMFYLMRTEIVDEFAAKLGKNRSGKSCIAMTPSKALSQDELLSMARQMLGRARA